jgi:hypothetical protein
MARVVSVTMVPIFLVSAKPVRDWPRTASDLDENVLVDKYEAFADLGQSMLAPSTADIRSVDGRHHGNPHIQVITVHYERPVEELLRTEILTLSGIIITRLGALSLTDHRVMPVRNTSAVHNAEQN